MTPYQTTVTVAAAGTPVQVSSSKLQCAMVMFVNRDSQIMTVGIAGLVKSTGVGVIDDLPAASASAEAPGSSILQLPFNPMVENPYNLADYWIDATSDGGKIDIIYWQV